VEALAITLTEQEYELIEWLRELADDQLSHRLTLSFEHGAWECLMLSPPHQTFIHLDKLKRGHLFIMRGTGTSPIEAMANLAFADDPA